MNIASFLEHWSIVENPFRAEEARHDPVFARLGSGPMSHPDFEKFVGDLARPSTAIVFGEKGSGKTAIRLQLADRVRHYNAEHPASRVLLIGYDDLNPMLDRVCERQGVGASSEAREVSDALKAVRLADHLDALLHLATAPLVDRVLGQGREGSVEIDLGDNPARELRRAERSLKQDLLVLQAVYDRPESAGTRSRPLRRKIKAPMDSGALLWNALVYLGWIVPAGVAFASFKVDPGRSYIGHKTWLWLFLGVLALWLAVLAKKFLWDRWRLGRLGKRVWRETRSVPRTPEAIAQALAPMPAEDRTRDVLPVDGSEETRYAMVARLRRVLGAFGYSGLLVVVDRVDEPVLVSGDPDRMRAVIWPMLSNKFLQQDGAGIKLLLPIELRHELFRESSQFFQEARLDKQNMIERLSWTGATLYDLCNARLRACLKPGAEPIALIDLFEEDVTRQDLVDALDQMHQPRDAFKLVYQCIQEHCSNVTDEQARWRIPRLVLEQVRKQQSERVQMLFRGIRPA